MHRYGLLVVAMALMVSVSPALAQNADTVDLLHASATPKANRLLALDASKHFPSSVWGVPFTLSGNTSGGVFRGFNSSSAANTSGVCGYSFATSGATRGVVGASDSTSGRGVYGYASSTTGATYGVYGEAASIAGTGVYGENTDSGSHGLLGGWMEGVHGVTLVQGGAGVWGDADNGYGVLGHSTNGYAGYFGSKVWVGGDLTCGGTKAFQIDHPLDPENMYLYHSCVESSERMNIYNGRVVLDPRGEAWVQLPDWFEALNCDFLYQLTPIGAPGPNLYIAQEISDGWFSIAGGSPGMKVCWQVTGTRQDPYALAHPFDVEVEKPDIERGSYLHPELYGMPETMSVEWATHPEAMAERHRDR